MTDYKSIHGTNDILSVASEGGLVYFSTTGEFYAALNPVQVRDLIKELEPHAAPPRTAQSDFEALPLGAAFRSSLVSDEFIRVKVTEHRYVIAGNAHGGNAITTFGGDEIPSEAVLTQVGSPI